MPGPYLFPDPRGWRRELRKQAGDQALHWLWGVATGALPFLMALAPSPWWTAGFAIALCNVIGMVVREWMQLRNGTDRWWDAPLDWIFLAFGVWDGLLIGALVLLAL